MVTGRITIPESLEKEKNQMREVTSTEGEPGVLVKGQ